MCGIWFLLNKNKEQISHQQLLLSQNIQPRGPDSLTVTNFNINNNATLHFYRLAINDSSESAEQPFKKTINTKTYYSVCNGEIYNHKKLSKQYNFKLESNSDCEILLHLFLMNGIEFMLPSIKGVFAGLIIEYDNLTNDMNYYVFRDRLGIRPLYICDTEDYLSIASEIKGIYNNDDKNNVFPFPIGSYFSNTYNFKKYWSLSQFNFSRSKYSSSCERLKGWTNDDDNDNKLTYFNYQQKLVEKFTESVSLRLLSDRPICCLLSGGLDSSLVAGMVSRLIYPRRVYTFSIGFEGATDFKYAQLVSKHINSIHTNVIINKEQALNAINEVIKVCETYDTTTIRASVWQYLLCKWISENTDFKVVMMGDGSDELFGGYIYFNKSPNASESHNECIKLLENINYYDVLRADRAVACHGLETRVPFLDSDFVEYVLSIPEEFRFPEDKKECEKYFLRQSFIDSNIIPYEVLMRKKEAFSDGISSIEDSWFVLIQKYIYEKYQMSENDYYMYKIKEYYGDKCKNNFIGYWLPNKKWVGEINDPSARMLTHYSK